MDSIATLMASLPKEKQIEVLLGSPYDKIVANTTKSEQLFLKGLKQAQQLKDKEAEADIYNQLATINGFLGNYDKRLDFNLKAIKIYEALNNNSKAGVTYGNLGFSMWRRDLEKAKFYMEKGIKLLEEANDFVALNSTYDNYGIVQEMSGNVDSAIYFYNKALDLKRNQKDSIGIPFALGHLSGAYLIKKDYTTSKKYLDESYNIRKRRNDTYGVAESTVLYADFYYAQNNYQEAVVWFTDCYKLAIENKYIHLGQYAAEFAAICYQKLGQFQDALIYQKSHQSLKDSLLNEKNNKAITELETQFETEKKEKQIAEQNILINKKELEIEQRNFYLYISIGLVVLILIVLFLIVKQIRFKQQKLIAANKLKDEISRIKLLTKLNEERVRISRDLHDNIGSQLTFIISSIDNMNYAMNDTNDELKNKLNELNEFSRSAITQLRDTIKTLNKSK
jgi:tetratricopeptide (TPR) repeat protein